MYWKEVDNAKPDGISVQVVMGAVLYVLVFQVDLKYEFLNIVVFLIALFLLLAYVGMPYAKRFEAWLFSSSNLFIRRTVIILVKALALVTAITAGLSNLRYWS